MKVANDLVRQGHVTSVRGRFGGMRLGRPPGEINVGAVIRHTEEGFALADCDACVIAPACGLTVALREALAAFMAVLDGYTLEDLLAKRLDIGALFAERAPARYLCVAFAVTDPVKPPPAHIPDPPAPPHP